MSDQEKYLIADLVSDRGTLEAKRVLLEEKIDQSIDMIRSIGKALSNRDQDALGSALHRHGIEDLVNPAQIRQMLIDLDDVSVRAKVVRSRLASLGIVLEP